MSILMGCGGGEYVQKGWVCRGEASMLRGGWVCPGKWVGITGHSHPRRDLGPGIPTRLQKGPGTKNAYPTPGQTNTCEIITSPELLLRAVIILLLLIIITFGRLAVRVEVGEYGALRHGCAEEARADQTFSPLRPHHLHFPQLLYVIF